jgi:hypothetical protein
MDDSVGATGRLVFADPAAPVAGSYGRADIAPGTTFSAHHGDVGARMIDGGLVSLDIAEALPTSVHGTLTFYVKDVGGFTATF